MTLPAMAELVDELQLAGYIERPSDPSDGRAKLIRPTRKGRRLLVEGLRAVHHIEAGYGATVGVERFEVLASALQDLVDARPEVWRGTAARSARRPADLLRGFRG
jgi:DNA-binding MarR family transcriptional regulator